MCDERAGHAGGRAGWRLSDGVGVLRAFVDDRQAELFVGGALSGQVRHVQDGGQPNEQARWLLAHGRMLPKPGVIKRFAMAW